MPIYIKIPKGFKFQQTKDENDNPIKDIIIDASGKQIILQDIVKEVLRDRNLYNAGKINTDGLRFFFKPPLKLDDSYLQYVPNKNGKLPTCKPVLLGDGVDLNISRPERATYHGVFWHQQLPLSESKREKVLSAQAAQKYNRQKIGDCPSTN